MAGAVRVMLIRHAEEAEGPDRAPNLDEHGLPDDTGLNLRGWQRAGALVRYLAPLHGPPADRALARPTSIIAMAFTPEHPTRRPALTVGLLAEALGIGVQQADDAARLLGLLHQARGPVLVCWRHGTLAAVARALAPRCAVPDRWPPDRYDLTWVIDRTAGGVRFRQRAQQLLPGDGADR